MGVGEGGRMQGSERKEGTPGPAEGRGRTGEASDRSRGTAQLGGAGLQPRGPGPEGPWPPPHNISRPRRKPPRPTAGEEAEDTSELAKASVPAISKGPSPWR